MVALPLVRSKRDAMVLVQNLVDEYLIDVLVLWAVLRLLAADVTL